MPAFVQEHAIIVTPARIWLSEMVQEAYMIGRGGVAPGPLAAALGTKFAGSMPFVSTTNLLVCIRVCVCACL